MKFIHCAAAALLLIASACSGGSSGSSSSSSGSSGSSGNSKDGGSKTERGYAESTQPESASAEGTEIVADTQYKAGERLKVSSLGFSYVVPEKAISVFATGGSAINIGEMGGDMLTLIVARTGVTEAEARDMISQPYDMGNAGKLTLQGEIEKSGDRLSAAMASPAICGHVQMLIGKSTGVAIMSIAKPGGEAACKEYSAKLAETVKFATPAGEKQRQEHEAGLMGKRAKVFIYKSAKDYSWSNETNKEWHFGSDHTYEYTYRNTNSSSGEAGGYAADNNANHAGTWRIELTLNYPTLILRTSEGRIITHTLTVVKGFLNIDGEEASLGASDRKK